MERRKELVQRAQNWPDPLAEQVARIDIARRRRSALWEPLLINDYDHNRYCLYEFALDVGVYTRR